jgi:dTDP-4-dehydrorhamnose reductase
MRLLLTGATGTLGRELVKIAPDFGLVFIPTSSRDFDISDVRSIRTYKAYNILNYQGVVHCAAFTDTTRAEIRKTKTIETNILGTRNVFNEFCSLNGVSYTYISTDYIYPSDIGRYSEISIPRPVNFYAWTKYAGEAYARPQDLIVRTSFKPSTWKHSAAFNDLYTSADYIDIIARKISFLISHKAFGVYNVGTERKSIYDLARRRNPNVQPISRDTIQDVNMPEDCSMDTSKYEEFVRRFIPGGGI